MKAFFDKLAQNWDQNRNLDEKYVEEVFKKAGVGERENILDIATGTGILIPELKKLKPLNLTAIDLSPEMLKRAREKYSDVTFINTDFYDFDPEEKYDLIVCYNSFPHFLDRDAFFRKCDKLLNTDGVLIIFHSDSSDVINARHENVKEYSRALKPEEEREAIKEYFDLVDASNPDENFYLIAKRPITE